MTQHYIEWLYAGSFFAENAFAKIAERALPAEIPERAAGYRIYSRTETQCGDELLAGRPRDYTGWVYFGTEYSHEQLAAKFGKDSILYQNIAGNGYKSAVRTIFGNWYPVNDGDVVVAKP